MADDGQMLILELSHTVSDLIRLVRNVHSGSYAFPGPIEDSLKMRQAEDVLVRARVYIEHAQRGG